MSNQLMLSPQEMQHELGGYREVWSDLGSVLADYESVGYTGDGSAHIWSPVAMERLGQLVNHPQIGRHHGDRHFHAIHNMLAHLYQLMRHNVDLKREKALWHEKANVVESVQWTAVPLATLSSTATVKAPYSGVNFMILDMIMPAELTPLGWWTQMTFAGINFAQPSLTSVTYGLPGTGGTPAQQGMGFSWSYTNKTAPDGSRGWSPWTGWILSSDAQVFLQWFNPDANFARSLTLEFLMRSSPCGALFQQNLPHAWHVSQGFSHTVDQIYGAVLGLTGAPMGAPNPMSVHGQGHYPSGGMGFPSGHMGPAGVPMHTTLRGV